MRIGIVGCGRIARLVHIPSLRRLAGVELTAVADPDSKALSAASVMTPSAQAFADWRQLIDARACDALVVTLPPALHAEAASAAIQAAMPVYVEKPLAMSLDEGHALVSAWRAAGVVGQVGLNFRHNPHYRSLRDRLAAGDLGRVRAIRTSFCSARRELPEWKRTRAAGGGVLRDLGTHHLDLIEFIAGEPIASLSAIERSLEHEADLAVVSGLTRSGIAFETLVSFVTGSNVNRVELFADEGHLTADTRDSGPRRIETPGMGRARRLWAAVEGLDPRRVFGPAGESSFDRAFAHFVAAARGEERANPDLAAGLRAMTLIAAAERAAVEGGAVAIHGEEPICASS